MIPPNILLGAYSIGYFPMADSDGMISWHSPDPRAIIPLNSTRIPRSTQQLIRKRLFKVKIDTRFEGVLEGCADRDETWINEEIKDSYLKLHELGYAHSIESFDSDGLAGGLYGVAMGSAFFGESMFSRRSGASKVALAFLINHLSERNFTLLDTQYITPHLQMFGAAEIPRKKYLGLLRTALETNQQFF
ncbi:MAG: leucyl/phenylalanyl-tRNA--protein transferase [Bacteroidetes bacterium]|nr:leucyl/phenylalanyl-tRNA--protein transferase [Bacteroidota bacterium]